MIKIVSTLEVGDNLLGLGMKALLTPSLCAVIERKEERKILSDVRKIYRPADGEEFIHGKLQDTILKIVL